MNGGTFNFNNSAGAIDFSESAGNADPRRRGQYRCHPAGGGWPNLHAHLRRALPHGWRDQLHRGRPGHRRGSAKQDHLHQRADARGWHHRSLGHDQRHGLRHAERQRPGGIRWGHDGSDPAKLGRQGDSQLCNGRRADHRGHGRLARQSHAGSHHHHDRHPAELHFRRHRRDHDRHRQRSRPCV